MTTLLTCAACGGSLEASLARFLTVAEYAAQVGVTRRTVYVWIEKGALITVRGPGGHPLIPIAEVRK